MSRKVTVASPSYLTFDSAVESFLNHRRLVGSSPTTLRFYSDIFRYLKAHQFPQNLTNCNTADVEEFITRLLNEGMKPVTVNGKIRAIRALFHFAHDREMLQRNPCESIRQVKHEKHIIRTLEPPHIHALLKECADGTFVGLRDNAMIHLMLDTGARASELLNIHITDLSLDKSTAIVMGKGRKARRIYFSERTRYSIECYLTERGALTHTSLFVSEDNRPLRLRSLQDRLRDLGQRAKINGVRVSPHTFRHTFAKMYIKNGGDVFTLQKMLGHTTIDMVRNYVEMFGDDVAEAHAKFSPVERMF